MLLRRILSVIVIMTLLNLTLFPVMADLSNDAHGNGLQGRLDVLPTVRSSVLPDDNGEENLLPWWVTTTMDEDGNKIFDILEKRMVTGETYPIFVDLSHDPKPSDVDMLEHMGLEVKGTYDIVDAIGIASATPTQIRSITELPGVVMVEPSGVPVLEMDVAIPNAKAGGSDLYSPQTSHDAGYSGKGIVITVMDTGQDNSHPGLAGKWVGGVDVSKPETPWWPRDGTFDADDTNGHGTTCAGIATGTGAPDGKYVGAAPEARLVDLRIGTKVGYAPGEGPQNFYDATLQGMEWAVRFADHEWPGVDEEHHGMEIISVSWSNDVGGSSDGNDVYSRGLNAVSEAGVIPIQAAGNAGPDNDGFRGLAAADLAIDIAATDDNETVDREDDFIAEYSSRGPRKDDGDDDPYEELKPDVAAPGTHITGLQYDQIGDGSGNGYGNRGSGTSYATPVVSGVVAMMLEANHNLTQELVREILHLTAERKGEPDLPELDPFWDKDFGWGIVDSYNATRMAASIENIDEYNTDLQSFIMNISTDLDDDKVIVEGISWARKGRVEKVEVSVDGGPWKRAKDRANDTWAKWVFHISKEGLSEGNHSVRTRALAGDKHSLEHEEVFVITEEEVTGGPMAGGPIIWVVLILSAISAVFVVYKRFGRFRRIFRVGRKYVRKVRSPKR